MTAATMFMDVVTDFGSKGSGSFLPTQADGLERGPVRLRSALQFSFNIPAIKAGIINGMDHVFNREQEFGLDFPPGADPGRLAVGRRDRDPPDRPARRVRRDRQRRRADAADDDPRGQGQGRQGRLSRPTATSRSASASPARRRRTSSRTSWTGNTVKSINPVWGQWQILEKTADGTIRRPAAYKTGTTNDRKDTAAFGYLAPPEDPDAPGPRRRRLDGQLRRDAEHRRACRSSRPRRCGRGS